MPKIRSEKDVLLQSYKELLDNSDGFIVLNPDKVKNLDVTDLKKKLKELGSKYVVVKNTLFKIALEDKGKPLTAKEFDGPSAVITYKADPTVVAKLIKDAQKKTTSLEARYGLIEGEIISKERVMGLAEIPSKNELLAKLLGSMNAPLSGLMNVMTGNIKGFVRVLSGLSEKK